MQPLRPKLALPFLFLVLSLSTQLFAQNQSTSNKGFKHKQANLPIEIKSDCAEFDQNKREVIHKGHVILTQGTNEVLADKLVLERDTNGQISHVIATGRPTKYHADLDSKKSPIHGRANTIHYYPETQQLILEGKAELNQNQDSFKGPKIIFNLKTKQVESTKSPEGRTTIVIQPKKK